MDITFLVPTIPALYYGWQYCSLSFQTAIPSVQAHPSHELSDKIKELVKEFLTSRDDADLGCMNVYKEMWALTEGLNGENVEDKIKTWIDSARFKVVPGTKEGVLPLTSISLCNRSNECFSTIFVNGEPLEETALSFAVGREVYHILKNTPFQKVVINLALSVLSLATFATLKKFGDFSSSNRLLAASLVVPFTVCCLANIIFSLMQEMKADIYALQRLKAKFSYPRPLDNAFHFLGEVAMRKSTSLWGRFKFFVTQPSIEARMVYLQIMNDKLPRREDVANA